MRVASEEIFGPVVCVLRFSGDRRSARAGEWDRLQPRGCGVDERHRSRALRLAPSRCGHRLDQHLWSDGYAVALGRHGRAVRHRPRPRPGGARELHRAEDGVAADAPARSRCLTLRVRGRTPSTIGLPSRPSRLMSTPEPAPSAELGRRSAPRCQKEEGPAMNSAAAARSLASIKLNLPARVARHRPSRH